VACGSDADSFAPRVGEFQQRRFPQVGQKCRQGLRTSGRLSPSLTRKPSSQSIRLVTRKGVMSRPPGRQYVTVAVYVVHFEIGG